MICTMPIFCFKKCLSWRTLKTPGAFLPEGCCSLSLNHWCLVIQLWPLPLLGLANEHTKKICNRRDRPLSGATLNWTLDQGSGDLLQQLCHWLVMWLWKILFISLVFRVPTRPSDFSTTLAQSASIFEIPIFIPFENYFQEKNWASTRQQANRG